MDTATLYPALRRFGGTINNAVLTGSLGDTFDLERFKQDNPETIKYRERRFRDRNGKPREARSTEPPHVFPPPYRPFGEKNAPTILLFPRKYVVMGIKTQADIDRWAEHIPKIIDYASGEPTVPEHVPDNTGFHLDPVLGYPSIANIVATYKFPYHFNLAKFNAEHLEHCDYRPQSFPGCSYKIRKLNNESSPKLVLYESGMVNAVGVKSNTDFETINTVLATLEDYAALPRGDTAAVEELDAEFKQLALDDDWSLSGALSEQFKDLTLEEQLHSFTPIKKIALEKLPPKGRSIILTREKERQEWIKIVQDRTKEQTAKLEIDKLID